MTKQQYYFITGYPDTPKKDSVLLDILIYKIARKSLCTGSMQLTYLMKEYGVKDGARKLYSE